MALTKAHLIEAVMKKSGLQRKDCARMVEHLLETMKLALADEQDILISGFGKFRVNEKSARKGRNPVTGEEITLSQRRVVTFKCSGKLKERINSE